MSENTNIQKITAKEGYLLTNGYITTDTIFVNPSSSIEDWWEIPQDENQSPNNVQQVEEK